jgi:hypothetical protein
MEHGIGLREASHSSFAAQLSVDAGNSFAGQELLDLGTILRDAIEVSVRVFAVPRGAVKP